MSLMVATSAVARRQLLLPLSDNYFCRRKVSKGVSPTTWQRSVIVVGRSHSFLVHPDEGEDKQSTIGGTQVSRDSRLVSMLTEILTAVNECRHDIYFLPNENGEQKNECRDVLLAFVKNPTKPHGLKLAKRLQAVTTHRSGLGLMFLIAGRDGGFRRIVVSRFPADHGILADEKKARVVRQVIDRDLLRNTEGPLRGPHRRETRSIANEFERKGLLPRDPGLERHRAIRSMKSRLVRAQCGHCGP
jgi:hypothetical protein